LSEHHIVVLVKINT